MESFIDVGCTSCGKTYEVPEQAAGRKAACPACSAMMQVPTLVYDSPTQASSLDPGQIPQPVSTRPLYSALGPRLVIDFGTTRTKVAYWDENKSQPDLVEIGIEVRNSMASAFYIPVEGTRSILVGDDAIDMVHADPVGVVIGLKKEIHRPGKKRVGQGRRALGRVELASYMFRHIREYCEDNVFHEKSITACTLTIPVAFEQQKRECIREAAQMAGFTDIELIEEPVAAAAHWLASPQALGTNFVVVCDVGGGTTDFALLRHDEGKFLAVPEAFTMGYLKGGNDLDVEIFESSVQQGQVTSEVVTEYRSGFLSAIRRLRERFGKTGQSRDVNIKGQSLGVTADTLRDCVNEFTGLVSTRLDEFTRKCTQEVPGCGSPPVLLVGGGSRIEGLKEKLESKCDWKIISWNQSDYAVALGAVTRPVNSVEEQVVMADESDPNRAPSEESVKPIPGPSQSTAGAAAEPSVVRIQDHTSGPGQPNPPTQAGNVPTPPAIWTPPQAPIVGIDNHIPEPGQPNPTPQWEGPTAPPTVETAPGRKNTNDNKSAQIGAIIGGIIATIFVIYLVIRLALLVLGGLRGSDDFQLSRSNLVGEWNVLSDFSPPAMTFYLHSNGTYQVFLQSQLLLGGRWSYSSGTITTTFDGIPSYLKIQRGYSPRQFRTRDQDGINLTWTRTR